MRLGLIGWYGHSNYGDERILYCIERFFSDNEFFITTSWSDARNKIDELNKCDYILIGGGGLILRNISHQTDLIHDLKRPFGLIGVSVEASHKSMKDFFCAIKQNAEFIMVRDRQSKEYLDNHYKVIVGPDLTFLYPFSAVEEVKNDVCGFNLRDWYYWKGTLHGNYHNLMLKIDTKFPMIRNIYPFKKWGPSNVVESVKKKFKKVLPIPFYFEPNTMNDVDVLSRYFNNVPSVFDINLYSNIRYIVGMRYHSIVFATQCGIPFISLSYQPKNITYCSDMGLNVLSADIYKVKDFEDRLEYIRNHYRQIRESLLSYREKCTRDIKYIFHSISYLIR
jgi:polysaccharide pyruvyl transferase WcaK-like protein